MKRTILVILLVLCLLTGCTSQVVAAPVILPVDQPADIEQSAPVALFEIIFDSDVAPILAEEDDYIRALSAYDYAAKFKSESPLDYDQRLQKYKGAIEPYTDDEKQRILSAFDAVMQELEGIKLELPRQIMVFSDGQIESGAAYTRQNAICLPKKMIGYKSSEDLTKLVAHELFHVISRYNQAEREAWYQIIGHRKVTEMVWPDELQALTIANPDAPQNNYVIRCQYNDQEYDFMSVIYADEPYPITSNAAFFNYLREGMMAVEVVDNTPKPIYAEGKLLIVDKSKLIGFTEQVGKNTDYTMHPEETTADHFALLISGKYKSAPNPEKIEALKTLMFN